MGPDESQPRVLDDAAIETLYLEHWSVLVAHARGFVPDRNGAMDVVHSFFLAFLLSARRGLAVCDPLPYMKTGVANAAFKFLKRRSREGSELDEANEPWQDEHAFGELEKKEVRDALDILDEDHRRAVLIRRYPGLSNDDGAKVFGLDSKRLSALYQEALERLREYENLGDEEKAKARANGPTCLNRLAEMEWERLVRIRARGMDAADGSPNKDKKNPKDRGTGEPPEIGNA